MNNDQKTELARRAMLMALSDCSSYLLSEPVFFSQVSVTVDPPPTRAEFKAHLAHLESRGLIVGVHPELGGPVKWGITDTGRATLAS